MVLKYATLAASSLKDAEEFYKKILGLETRLVGDVLCVGDCVLKIVEGTAGHPQGTFPYHVALRLPDRRGLGAVLRRVLEFEEVVEGFADHLVSESIYVRDFDGIGVELYVDKPREQWRIDERRHVVMDTLPLDVRRLLSEAGPSPGRPALGHVHMRTDKVGEAERFYAGLGFRVTGRWMGAVFMAYGDYHHLAFNAWPLQPPRRGAGIVEIGVEIAVDSTDPLGVRVRGP